MKLTIAFIEGKELYYRVNDHELVITNFNEGAIFLANSLETGKLKQLEINMKGFIDILSPDVNGLLETIRSKFSNLESLVLGSFEALRTALLYSP